jgi:transcriptional regulator with XRE-family HTH domain
MEFGRWARTFFNKTQTRYWTGLWESFQDIALLSKEKKMQETAKVNPQAFETARKSQLLDKNSLARMAGVSSLTITRLETGKPVLLKNIKKVMTALGYTVDDKDRFFM